MEGGIRPSILTLYHFPCALTGPAVAAFSLYEVVGVVNWRDMLKLIWSAPDGSSLQTLIWSMSEGVFVDFLVVYCCR